MSSLQLLRYTPADGSDEFVEVTFAHDEILIAKELLEAADPRWLVIDWPFIAIQGKTTYAYYEVVGEDLPRNAWIAKKKDAKCLT